MTSDITKNTTAKNPAKKKVAKKTAVKAKETPTKKAAKKPTTTKPQTSSINITSEERWKMIAIAAYHKAEIRGFASGGELQDWTEAEQEIDELLMSN